MTHSAENDAPAYKHITGAVLYECPECFAVVDMWGREKHAGWHENTRVTPPG